MAVVKNLMVRAGADFSGLKKETEKAQRTLQDFKNSTSKVMNGIKNTLLALGIGKLIKDAVGTAMTVESAIGQINRTMGNNAAGFQKWVNTQASAYGLAKSEALQYGAVYSNLVAGFSKNTSEVTQNTENLLKASSIIASSTGRSMEDVMERIRSGLLGNTESIEDLGVNVNIAMIQSTEAFKRFANGKSWQQLDFQTQQQIRLMAILEQTSAKYGDTLVNNTNYKQMMFVAQLKNAQLALGQAFLPIYNIILPALTSLATALTNVLNVVAQFSQAIFGKSNAAASQTQAVAKQAAAVKGLGTATETAGSKAKKAGKDAKGALASFDEINSLSKNADSGGDASSGTSGGAMPAMDTGAFASSTVAVSDKIKAMTNKIKAIFASVSNFISSHKDVITSTLAGIGAGFAALGTILIIKNWPALVKIFEVTKELSPAMEALNLVISSISVPILLASAAIGLLIGNIVYLWKTNEDFRKSVIDIWNQIKTFVTTVVSDMWNIVKGIWDKYGQTLLDNLAGFMKSIQNTIINVWESIIKPLITIALSFLTDLWNNHLKGLIQQVGEFIMKLVNGALEIYNKFISPITNWLIQIFGPVFINVFANIMKIVGGLIGVVADVAKGVFKALGGIIDFVVGVFTGNWSKAWQGVKEVFGGIWDSLVAVAKVPLNAIIGLINNAISGINSVTDIINNIPGVHIKGIPTIPKLAKGGITNGPTMALIGDNPGGKEVVSPLDKLQDMLVSAVGTAILETSQFNPSNSSGGGDIYLQVDGTTFARIIKPYQANENQRVGNSMIIQTV